MPDALVLKENGTAAFRACDFPGAFKAYSEGIACLCPEASTVIVDHGLAANAPAPSAALELAPDDKLLLTTLCTNRAAVALKLGRPIRALADTSLAASLTPSSPKVAFRRAAALLAIGACEAAQAILEPHVASEPELRRLSETARSRAAKTMARIEAMADAPNTDHGAATTDELAFVGPIEVRRMGGERGGRGWFATRQVAAGELLLAEPACLPLAPPANRANPLPLTEAICTQLGGLAEDRSVAWRAEELRERLACVHPVPGVAEDAETSRDAETAPEVAAIAAATGVSAAEATAVERKVARNQFSLRMRVRGEDVNFGSGLFPLASLLNHSCEPAAHFQPLSSGRLLVVRSIRDVEAGAEVCDSYVCVACPFAERQAKLQASHSFTCRCVRCDAPEGTRLHMLERFDRSLVCPLAHADGGGEGAHVLLPDSPYADEPAYRCAAAGCEGRLAAEEASGRLQSIKASFEELEEFYARGEALAGCKAAKAAERSARSFLSPQHTLWRLWLSCTILLATDAREADASASAEADDPSATEELVLGAYRRREVMLLVPHRATDDDIFVRMSHALLVGLETSEAEALLQQAFRLDGLTYGASVDGFVQRWVPADFGVRWVERIRQIVRAIS